MNEERNRAISIFKEIKELIPGYFEGKIPSNKKCDLKKIGSLTDELRSEGYLFYSSEVELDELISIAYELTNRVKLANYDPEATFFVIDNILDSIWHQKKSEDSSDSNKRNLASLAINILGFNIGKYWVDELAPSASNFNVPEEPKFHI